MYIYQGLLFKMKIYDEYFSLLSSYKKKYGEKTFLIYQVGSFFEVYGVEGNLENIQSILILLVLL